MPEDVEGIHALIDASVRGLQKANYSAAQIEASLKSVFTIDSQLIGDGTYFIAETDDGELAGCGGWSKRKTLFGGDHQIEKIEPELLEPSVGNARIRAIFVHPEFARRGLGSMILAAAENAAVEAGFRSFELGSTLTGVALYTLKGYREVDRVLVPVGGGEAIDVVRMVKNVSAICAISPKQD